jgi:hypothetical protein
MIGDAAAVDNVNNRIAAMIIGRPAVIIPHCSGATSALPARRRYANDKLGLRRMGMKSTSIIRGKNRRSVAN